MLWPILSNSDDVQLLVNFRHFVQIKNNKNNQIAFKLAT